MHIWYWPGDESVAERALEEIGRLRFPGLPGDALERGPLSIYLAPDDDAFHRIARGAPEWGAGVALPEQGVVVIPLRGPTVQAGEWRRILVHEAAHVALRRHLDARVPRWFDEGYAQLAAGSWDADAAWQLRLAILMGRAPPLDSLTLDFPARAPEARVAYLLSYTAVRDLHDLAGADAFAAMLRGWRETGDIDRAIRATYGLTLGQFERLWRESVRSRYGWLLVVSQAIVIWTGFTLLFLALGAWVHRRRRLEFEAMRAREAAEAAGTGGAPAEPPGGAPEALDLRDEPP